MSVGLIGGNADNEGRVEVNYNGTWGTVCDDFWSQNDANVVCQQLGYGTAATWPRLAEFGQGRGQIWLDNLRCTGNETDLFSCPHNGPGNHNCGHNEDASVVCTNIRKYNWFKLLLQYHYSTSRGHEYYICNFKRLIT